MKKTTAITFGLLVILAVYLLWVNMRNKTEAPVITPVETPTVIKQVVLRQDGLGVINFGKTPEEAIAVLNPILGQPSKDTGWVDSFSTYGTCPGVKIRGIEWNRLHLLFGDTLHGEKKFFGFEYVDRNGINKPLLETEKSITLGATKEEIKLAYPNATFGEWLPGQTGTTFVRGAEGSGQYLGGTIEDNKLFWISGGIFCGE
jgi:hypothetical protein